MEREFAGIRQALEAIAEAITPDAQGAQDATGSYVKSLTEAVMGMTTGLCNIADAINNLADAVRETSD